MKKIVHIINGLDQGGTERALLLLLSALQANNHSTEIGGCEELYQFHIIVLTRPGYFSQQIEALNLPIHYLYIQKNPFRACKNLYQHLKRIEPEIVHTWLYHADLIGGIIAKLCGIKKIIWSIRCEGIGLKKSTQVIQHICAILSKKIPHQIIVNSQSAMSKHAHMGYQHQKMQLIYNGFDTKKFYPTSPQIRCLNDDLSIPKNKILLGTLARNHPDKDYSTLIKIIDAVCQTDPNILFVFCGQGCHALESNVAQLTHASQVLLIDGVKESHLYLNAIDIFIQSSKTESFSNSLAEAMLCGLPCIATDVGETATICPHGMIITKEDPQQLAQACLDMVKKSPRERKKLGKLARKHVEQCYSIEEYLIKIRTLYL